ncbi:MAG: ATP-binding protein [Ginsengibacter sp.]
MHLLLINIETRIIIGITAMVLLFTCFIIAFIYSQKKKIQYHKDLNDLNEQQKSALTRQNESLEKRVQDRTLELSQQKEMLQKSLDSLKSTQLQLIQSEKMASLGVLTAGIAHEIQNPLNFVNNFSDINKELLSDMKDEISKGNLDEVRAIANDITENEEKISHHGRRADAIVKGMLQHSGGSTGAKEPTDINVLCDEYLRLSFHGFKAKDKSFNATIKTDFDSSIGKIEIVPQDMGRVLLNLFTNAFYALSKKKSISDSSYQPTILIQTIKLSDNVKIIIQDNGTGIPTKITEKIFQPFFTTKPTGEGTGLGLSISYDIIKAHSGKLTVESEEGIKTTFIIEIPLS